MSWQEINRTSYLLQLTSFYKMNSSNGKSILLLNSYILLLKAMKIKISDIIIKIEDDNLYFYSGREQVIKFGDIIKAKVLVSFS